MKIETFSAEETYKIGEQMGREAKAGDVLCLVGDLGVGKTVFTQGFAAGLGITEPVSSPTFTIVQTPAYKEGAFMNIHESAEDYLERILMLRLKKRHGSFH